MRARARLVLRKKGTDLDGDIVELVAWELPGPKLGVGLRYRLAFVPRGSDSPAVLDDNHQPKGPHRHFGELEEAYVFVDIETLIGDFYADVERWKRIRQAK